MSTFPMSPRWSSPLATGLLMLGLAGCQEPPKALPLEPDSEVAPAPGTAITASAERLTVADFIAAQGTWCTATGGPTGCTNLFGPEGPSDALVWCDYYNGEPYPCLYADFGVWERYVQQETGTGYGSRYTGQVTERPLQDGRRLVKVELHGTNVLSMGLDEAAFYLNYDDPVTIANAMVIGASPYELVNHLRPPTLGNLHFTLEIVLPSDYVGLPDMVEMFVAPAPGMELRSLQLVNNVQGTTRMAFGTVPAGVAARLVSNLPWNLELAGRLPEHAAAHGLRITEFSPGVQISLKQLGR